MTPKKQSGADRTRSESVRATLEKKRAALPDEWHPCLWCGNAIPADRVKTALLTKQEPKYCDDLCRRNAPARSLVARMFANALGAGKGDEAAWRAFYETRLDAALEAPAKTKGGRK